MDSFSDILTQTPIVIDNGSGCMKIGFAGEEKPKITFPSYVGRPKYKSVYPNLAQTDYLVGKQENLGLMKIKYPINHGIINNWNDMDYIWKYAFNELKAYPKDFPIFLTEPPLNPYQHKFQMAQHFFENYNAPALFIGIQGMLSLFASGKSTGVVLDCGDGVSQVVPVFEGYSLSHANQRIDIAGRDITEYLQLLLRRSGYSFHTSAEFEMIRKIKEQRCMVSPSALHQSEDKLIEEGKIKENVALPDGNIIEMTYEKQRAAEILFAPDKIGLEYPSIPELLIQSIQKVDIDLRRTLYSEVVLSGGTTMMEAFPDRIINEVKKLTPKDVKLKFYVPPERKYLCWTGASILCNLNSFKNMWILKKEYEEDGDRILLKKSF